MNIGKAILKINPNAIYIVRGNDIDTCEIEWLEETTPISKNDIKNKMLEMAYIEKREKEYPSIKDQLDKIYHSGLNEWKKVIKATKDKYPKD